MDALPKPIRQRVNQSAHRLALQYENDVRNSLLAQLIEIADSGATMNELIQTLNKILANGEDVVRDGKCLITS